MSKRDERYTVAAIVIGAGGWTLHGATGPTSGTFQLSGYGSDWVRYLTGEPRPGERADDAAARARYVVPDGCPVVDLTACTEDDRWVLAVAGPMVGPTLEPGTISPTMGGAPGPYDPSPDPARGVRFSRLGRARSLDYVAPDVYARIAARFGAIVATAGEHRAALAGGPAGLEDYRTRAGAQ